MNLWVDDVRPAPPGWTHAYSVKQAIMYARDAHARAEFEEASLDHDLGRDDDFLIPNGLAFVDWMLFYGIWPQKMPRVHSMNPIGRQRMEATIARYYGCGPMLSRAFPPRGNGED